jgi:thiamine pyrophosphokinase
LKRKKEKGYCLSSSIKSNNCTYIYVPQSVTLIEERVRSEAAASSSASAAAPSTPSSTTIVALGALGGRLDHSLGNLNALHLFAPLRLILVGDGNTARLLPPGRHVIRVAPGGREGPHCGVIPLAGPAVVSSKGLKWDMGETF